MIGGFLGHLSSQSKCNTMIRCCYYEKNIDITLFPLELLKTPRQTCPERRVFTEPSINLLACFRLLLLKKLTPPCLSNAGIGTPSQMQQTAGLPSWLPLSHNLFKTFPLSFSLLSDLTSMIYFGHIIR